MQAKVMAILQSLPSLKAQQLNCYHLDVSPLETLNFSSRQVAPLLLTEGELATLTKRKSSLQKCHFLLSRLVIKYLVSDYYQIKAEKLEVKFCHQQNQLEIYHQGCLLKVSLVLSHSGSVLSIAIVPDSTSLAIGIDVEKFKAQRNFIEISQNYFHPQEYQLICSAQNPESLFYQLWTQKEALAKALKQPLMGVIAQQATQLISQQQLTHEVFQLKANIVVSCIAPAKLPIVEQYSQF